MSVAIQFLSFIVNVNKVLLWFSQMFTFDIQCTLDFASPDSRSPGFYVRLKLHKNFIQLAIFKPNLNAILL